MARLFKEREVQQQRSKKFMYGLGIVGLFGLLGLIAIGFNAPNAIPGRSYYTIQAAMDNADNLTPHSQVRLDGKLVGQVLNPRVVDGVAVVDLQMDSDDGPLKSDTRIEVRPRSPVGVRYVNIIPGTKGTNLKNNQRLPASQSTSTRPLDEVLSTLDPKTRARTQSFFREFGTGLMGRGDDLAATFQQAPDFLNSTADVLGTVENAKNRGSLKQLIDGGAVMANAADPVRESIRLGFKPEAASLRPFTQESNKLHETLDIAPGSLTDIRNGLVVAQPLITNVRTFARAVRPVLNYAPYSLGQTSALLKESRPGLVATSKTLNTLGSAVDPVLSLLASVKVILPRLDAMFPVATPIVKELGAHGCNLVEFGKHWGSMMSYADKDLGNDGGVLRFVAVAAQFSGVGDPTTPRNAYPAPCQAGREIPGGNYDK